MAKGRRWTLDTGLSNQKLHDEKCNAQKGRFPKEEDIAGRPQVESLRRTLLD